MGLFKGFIARRLLVSLGLLAVLVAIGTAVSFWGVQFLSHTMSQVQLRTDASVLSARIQAESLNLINLAQLYTQATREERPTVRASISEQQTRLQDLVRQAKKITSSNDVTETIAIGNVENGVISFSYQTNSLLNAIDSSSAASGELVGCAVLREVDVDARDAARGVAGLPGERQVRVDARRRQRLERRGRGGGVHGGALQAGPAGLVLGVVAGLDAEVVLLAVGKARELV